MSQAEHAEYLRQIHAQDYERLAQVGSRIQERQSQIAALAQTPGGEFLLELWNDQLEHSRSLLETCEPERLLGLQYEVAVYRRWIALLTQTHEINEEPDA